MKNLGERLMINEWSNLFGGWKTCFCITLSVRVNSFIGGCTCVLIMGAWWESQQGSQQFDKSSTW
jgi:hypothetical protein